MTRLDRRFPLVTFLVDANCINARQTLAAINDLEVIADKGLIELLMPSPADDEACRGGDSFRDARIAKVYRRISLCVTYDALCAGQDRRVEIEQLAFPGGVRSGSEANDVQILEVARQTRIPLITRDAKDRGPLANAIALKTLGISVMSPEAALQFFYKRLTETTTGDG